MRDITARKQTEADLLAAKADGRAGNRPRISFLATLSHELRTPLTPVLAGNPASERRDDLRRT